MSGDNTAASVHDRLLSIAREGRRAFNELLQYYAIERFLYRLAQSQFADLFILKGALMLYLWSERRPRSTRDIDLLGRTSNDPELLADIVRQICRTEVQPDGLEFDQDSVQTQTIIEDGTYEGVRARFHGQLATAVVHMQLDIGFGDVIVPCPTTAQYPSLLGMPSPTITGYSRESTIAEKLQAMVALDAINSRMKDFYDIRFLAHGFHFDGATLAEAIQRTFARRSTSLPPNLSKLFERLSTDSEKQQQWVAFLRRSVVSEAPRSFADIIESIEEFVEPPISALASDGDFVRHWTPPGPWR